MLRLTLLTRSKTLHPWIANFITFKKNNKQVNKDENGGQWREWGKKYFIFILTERTASPPPPRRLSFLCLLYTALYTVIQYIPYLSVCLYNCRQKRRGEASQYCKRRPGGGGVAARSVRIYNIYSLEWGIPGRVKGEGSIKHQRVLHPLQLDRPQGLCLQVEKGAELRPVVQAASVPPSQTQKICIPEQLRLRTNCKFWILKV